MRGKRIHRLLSIVLVVVLLLSALPLTALASTDKPADGTTNGQPFSSGTGGSTNFRIPALITLSNGYLLAAADARYSDTGDGYGLDTIVSYSADKGSTWHYSYVNYFNDSKGHNRSASAFIDPVLVQDKDNTVYLFADLFPGGGHNIGDIETGTGFVKVGNDSYLALYSTSNATSFSDPIYYVDNELKNGYYTVYNCNDNKESGYALDAEYNIYEVSGDVYTAVEGSQLDSRTTIQANVFYTGNANPSGPYVLGTQYITMRKGTVNGDSITWGELQLLDVKKDTESFYGLGPGGGIVTSTGRIIVPLYTYRQYWGDGNTSVIYSDDNGVTWARSADMNVQTSEASISEVTVGGQNYLYMFTRHGGYFVSENNGETWSDKKNVSGISYTTGCELSTLTYSKLINGCPAILLSAPTSDRTNGKIFVGLVQQDGSINWEYNYQVNNGTFQYSDLAELRDGSIGLLYESGGAAITYTNLSIDTIAKDATIGASEPETPDDNAGVDVSLYVGQSKAYTDRTGNYAGSYDGSGLNSEIATVDVTGQDGQLGSVRYNVANNVSCNDLISEDFSNWVKIDNYYCTPDEGQNYYPVYATRSSNWIGSITYTWGYSITDSPTDVKELKTQASNAIASYFDAPNITVYTQSSTEAVPASTTITITGVAPGATSVVVGNTLYNITVNELPPVLDLDTTPFVANTGVGGGKKVTKLTTSVGLTFDLDLNPTGSNVVWSVEDTSIATVDQYGIVTGCMAGETTVTATIDGVAYTIPVVIRADANNNRRTKIYDIYLSEITNTSVYMSISCSTDLIEVQAGEAIYLSFDKNANTAVDFFGAPDEGYALTRMSATNSDGYYQALDNSDPKLTDFYTTENTAGYIQREYFTDDGVAAMVQAALYEGCDGGLGFTRHSRDNASVTSDLTFRSEKLPTVSKEVATVNGVTYTEGMVAHENDVVVFEVTVTQYAAKDPNTYITYTGVTLTDKLPGAVFAGSESSTKHIDLGDASVSADTTYTCNVEYTIKVDDLDKTITNTVDLTYTYRSQYSSGSFASEASADAKITAATFEPEDIVIDFGLPVTMDYSGQDAHGRYDLVSGTANYGSVDVINNVVTYTPTQVLPEADTVTLTNKAGGTYTFKVIPASNVLYEETFLTDAEDWNKSGTSPNTTQSCDNDLRYGYDEVAYNGYADYSNGTVYQATGLSADKLSTGKLSTSFYGNGFDLIGECAPDTAMVYLVIKDASGKAVKGAIVDTRFADSNVNGSRLYQVPLAHLMLETEGSYTAEVSAYYVAAPAESSSVQAVSTFSVSGASSRSDVEALYQIIDAAYEDDLDFVDIEFFYFDENSPIASMNQSVSMFNAMGSTPSVAKTSGNVKTAGTRSTIDGFRVYRSSNNDAYLPSEQDVQYVNVLDAVKDEFAGYIEGGGNGTYNKGNYESSGGPQNEIYLPAGAAVTFQTNLTEGTTVQISARAVSGTASLNGTAISTNTEMYYTLTVGENGVITVTNDSATNVTGMLALGNLKLPATVMLSVPTEETYAIAYTMLRGFSETPVEPEPEPDPVFVPDKLDIDVTSRTVLFNRLVSITIKSSTDVAKLTVNGKTILPINVLLVKFGRADSYMYLFMDTVRRGQTESYEIVAYNAEGVASEVHTVEG